MFMLFCSYLTFSQPKTVVKDSTIQNNRAEIKDLSETICGADIEAYINRERWTAYLNENLILDDAYLDSIPVGTYKVFVQFVVDAKGKLNDIKIITNPGYGLGNRVRNVIAQYKGRWIPEEFNEHATASYHRQPVTFIVEEKDKCEQEILIKSIL
jgi:hypothetical protein